MKRSWRTLNAGETESFAQVLGCALAEMDVEKLFMDRTALSAKNSSILRARIAIMHRTIENHDEFTLLQGWWDALPTNVHSNHRISRFVAFRWVSVLIYDLLQNLTCPEVVSCSEWMHIVSTELFDEIRLCHNDERLVVLSLLSDSLCAQLSILRLWPKRNSTVTRQLTKMLLSILQDGLLPVRNQLRITVTLIDATVQHKGTSEVFDSEGRATVVESVINQYIRMKFSNSYTETEFQSVETNSVNFGESVETLPNRYMLVGHKLVQACFDNQISSTSRIDNCSRRACESYLIGLTKVMEIAMDKAPCYDSLVRLNLAAYERLLLSFAKLKLHRFLAEHLSDMKLVYRQSSVWSEAVVCTIGIMTHDLALNRFLSDVCLESSLFESLVRDLPPSIWAASVNRSSDFFTEASVKINSGHSSVVTLGSFAQMLIVSSIWSLCSWAKNNLIITSPSASSISQGSTIAKTIVRDLRIVRKLCKQNVSNSSCVNELLKVLSILLDVSHDFVFNMARASVQCDAAEHKVRAGGVRNTVIALVCLTKGKLLPELFVTLKSMINYLKFRNGSSYHLNRFAMPMNFSRTVIESIALNLRMWLLKFDASQEILLSASSRELMCSLRRDISTLITTNPSSHRGERTIVIRSAHDSSHVKAKDVTTVTAQLLIAASKIPLRADIGSHAIRTEDAPSMTDFEREPDIQFG